VCFACIWVCTMALGGCSSAPTSSMPDEPRRDNLGIMRTLAGEISAELNARYGPILTDTVVLGVDSAAAAWIVRSQLSSALSAGGHRILAEGQSPTRHTRWTVHGVTMSVSYSNIRKPGIFSAALVDREIRAEFTSEISNAAEIVWTGTSARVSRDTVKENEIATLESGGSDFTRGKVPDLRSWDMFIEPFVIIGAAGTAIFLFFQVRS